MPFPVSDERVLEMARAVLATDAGDEAAGRTALEIGSKTALYRADGDRAVVYQAEVLVEPRLREGKRCAEAAVQLFFDADGTPLHSRPARERQA